MGCKMTEEVGDKIASLVNNNHKLLARAELAESRLSIAVQALGKAREQLVKPLHHAEYDDCKICVPYLTSAVILLREAIEAVEEGG